MFLRIVYEEDHCKMNLFHGYEYEELSALEFIRGIELMKIQ